MSELINLLKATENGTLGEVTDEQLSALATYYSVQILKPGEEGKEASKKLLQLFRSDWPRDFYKRFELFVLESVRNEENPKWRRDRQFIQKMGTL